MDPVVCMMMDEDFLNFLSEEEDEDDDKPKAAAISNTPYSKPNFNPPSPQLPIPEMAEEELEWLSNKDAFPAVETFFDIVSPTITNHNNHLLTEIVATNNTKQQSPVSVLEDCTTTNNNCTNSNGNGNGNSSSSITSCFEGIVVPHRSRSKRSRRRRRRGDLPGQQCWWSTPQQQEENVKQEQLPIPPTTQLPGGGANGSGVQTTNWRRRCQHCLADTTPQWRAGPMGPKTLCNACGVRYKSGRLVPEYRPANSPTFSSVLHSNSHRKVMEMRKMKQHHHLNNEPCGYVVQG